MSKKLKSYFSFLVPYSKTAITVPLLLILPFTSLNLTPISLFGPMTYVAPKEEGIIFTDHTDRENHARKIDAYFAENNLPLSGFGMKFVVEAEKYNLPWNLTAAIAMRESTGGKFMFAKNNPFGWGKRVKFKTLDEAIEVVSWNLGGYNPKTAKYYDGKTVEEIINTYNPPYVVHTYLKQIKGIMKDINETTTVNPILAIEFES